MEAMVAGGFDVFAYASVLHTRSPLLQWLYCESHALEPWAAFGTEARQGEYRFPGVLAVPHDAREALLDRVFADVVGLPGWARDVERRFEAAARRVLRALARLRPTRAPRAAEVAELLDATARVLAVGVFKEALTTEGLLLLLGEVVPAERVRQLVPRLWQPRCLPHFLKFELRSLHAAERRARGQKHALREGIARAAHHSRFLVEDAPFHEPRVFEAHLHALARGRGAAALRGDRLRRLEAHRRARARADQAEREVLAQIDAFARTTLETRLRVHALLRFVRFVATAEELKHVLVVEVARACRLLMDARGLDVETTGAQELLAALHSPSAVDPRRDVRRSAP